MKHWKLILTLVAALAVVAYLVISWTVHHDDPQGAVCTGVQIQVLDSAQELFVTRQTVLEQLQRTGQYPVGKHFSEVHPALMEQALRLDPMVRTADCHKHISGQVSIEVTQRVPVMRVAARDNYYMDAEGQRFPTSRRDAARVPVVTGHPTAEFVRGPLLKLVLYLEQDEFWRREVEQINITHDRRLQIVLRTGDYIIQMESMQDYPQKLRKVRQLYERGLRQQGWPEYSIIDVEYKNQIVCRKRGN